ncbi:MAG: hypothetical protein ACTSRS_14460 [Candidatus Helarchaeota archaeon]
MQSGRYIFLIIVFFLILTGLILLLKPIKIGNAILSSYYGVPPDESTHYTQVPSGTTTTAIIIIDNTPSDSYDLVNFSLKFTVYADIAFVNDAIIISRSWNQNLTVLQGEQRVLKLYFNATYPHPNTRLIYIHVTWGFSSPNEDGYRLSELSVNSEFIKESFFSFKNSLALILSIGLILILFILGVAIRNDIKRWRKRKTPLAPSPPSQPGPPPSQEPTPISSPASIPDSHLVPPSAVSPPSTITPPSSTPIHMELIPCPKCSSKIDKTQVVCPNCGYELTKCAICNLVIEGDEETETCPECGATGHQTHFREWVHVKGTCPICKKKITFE